MVLRDSQGGLNNGDVLKRMEVRVIKKDGSFFMHKCKFSLPFYNESQVGAILARGASLH